MPLAPRGIDLDGLAKRLLGFVASSQSEQMLGPVDVFFGLVPLVHLGRSIAESRTSSPKPRSVA